MPTTGRGVSSPPLAAGSGDGAVAAGFSGHAWRDKSAIRHFQSWQRLILGAEATRIVLDT